MMDETATAIRATINRFNSAALENVETDALNRAAVLAQALDGLVEQYNRLPMAEPDDGPDAPRTPHELYQNLYDQAGRIYPDLGYYPDVDPKGDTEQDIGLADAIDDIVDIARDLNDVIWYLDNGFLGSAIWDFRFGYQSHWGEHLHRLRRVLHHMMHY